MKAHKQIHTGWKQVVWTQVSINFYIDQFTHVLGKEPFAWRRLNEILYRPLAKASLACVNAFGSDRGL